MNKKLKTEQLPSVKKPSSSLVVQAFGSDVRGMKFYLRVYSHWLNCFENLNSGSFGTDDVHCPLAFIVYSLRCLFTVILILNLFNPSPAYFKSKILPKWVYIIILTHKPQLCCSAVLHMHMFRHRTSTLK